MYGTTLVSINGGFYYKVMICASLPEIAFARSQILWVKLIMSLSSRVASG